MSLKNKLIGIGFGLYLSANAVVWTGFGTNAYDHISDDSKPSYRSDYGLTEKVIFSVICGGLPFLGLLAIGLPIVDSFTDIDTKGKRSFVPPEDYTRTSGEYPGMRM